MEDLVGESRKAVGLDDEEADAMSEAITNRIISSLDGLAVSGESGGPPLIHTIGGWVFTHSGQTYGIGVLPNHKNLSLYRVSNGAVRSIATFSSEAEANDFVLWLNGASVSIGDE